MAMLGSDRRRRRCVHGRGRVPRGAALLAVPALVACMTACGTGDGSPGDGAASDDGDAGVAAAAPEQLVLFYYAHNGTVAPEGAYSVSIRVSSDGQGRLDYEQGYGEARDSLLFEVNPERVLERYTALRPRLEAVDPAAESAGDEPEVGGPVSSFRVTADSVEYRLRDGGVDSLDDFLPEPLSEIRRRFEAGAP
ncbi:MAG: hypothetical protein R3195_02770 [Gemmatimonadota bacterium]|nr:hypothetical protein [Gemmatimonadota bacterium]